MRLWIPSNFWPALLLLSWNMAVLPAAVVGQAPATYFVAVTGSDASSGSRGDPFATLGQALTVMEPGDTVYVREGTYASPATIRVDLVGVDSARINIFAFPRESPVFDFTGNDREGLDIRGSHVHVMGLTLEKAGRSGLFIKGGSSNIVEAVSTRFNRNSGLQVEDGASDNLILNTDSYGNYDPQNHGENADGFAVKFDVGPGNTLRACRAWGNSDDGFDFWEASEGVTVEGSWAFRNGIDLWDDSDFQGDSNGFKLGHGAGAHRLVRNLAWDHLKHGFDVNGNTTGVTLYNNTAFDNEDRNFYFDEDNSAHVLRNNVSVSGDVLMLDAIDDSTNSWNGFNVGGADFLSLSDSGADGPRSADGSLPRLDFLRLASDSKLVDAGVDVGISFEGAAPDLGAFETEATGVKVGWEIPVEVGLSVVSYPNPFSHSTSFLLGLPAAGDVEIQIVDVGGRQVDVLRRDFMDAGPAVIPWQPDPARFATGIYFVRFVTPSHRASVPVVFTPAR